MKENIFFIIVIGFISVIIIIGLATYLIEAKDIIREKRDEKIRKQEREAIARCADRVVLGYNNLVAAIDGEDLWHKYKPTMTIIMPFEVYTEQQVIKFTDMLIENNPVLGRRMLFIRSASGEIQVVFKNGFCLKTQKSLVADSSSKKVYIDSHYIYKLFSHWMNLYYNEKIATFIFNINTNKTVSIENFLVMANRIDKDKNYYIKNLTLEDIANLYEEKFKIEIRK